MFFGREFYFNWFHFLSSDEVSGHKRAAILLLIKEHEDYADLFQEVCGLIKCIVPDV